MSTHILGIAAAALAGGFLFRVRGGWPPLDPPGSDKNFKARMAWAVPTALLVGLLSGSVVALLAAFALAWAGEVIEHKSWQRMTDEQDWLEAAALGAARLIGLLLPGAVVLHDPWLALLGLVGVLAAPLWWVGWRLPVLGGPVDAPTAWGELFYGALAWGVLVAVL